MQLSCSIAPILEPIAKAIQENHYDPFGLNLKGLETQGDFRWLYNAQNELETLHELDLYETPFRSYDAQLGRFHQADPLAPLYDGISPYQYAYNNPISFNDPMGLEAEASPSVVPSTTSGAAPVANEVKEEDKSDDLPDAPILEPIKEMPTLASAGPNVEMTLEKMPVAEQSAGDDEGGNESGAVAEENSIEHQLNAAKSWGNGGANNNAEDSKFVGSFAFVNASHSPNSGAWEHTKKWDDAAIKGFGEFIVEMAKTTSANKGARILSYKIKEYTDLHKQAISLDRDDYATTPLQCSQSVILLLLIYAKENGLPVHLKRTGSNGSIQIYNSKIHSIIKMLYAARVFSPKDLKDSDNANAVALTSKSISNGLLQLIVDSTTKHAAVYYRNSNGYPMVLQAAGTIRKGVGASFTLPHSRSATGVQPQLYQFNFNNFNKAY